MASCDWGYFGETGPEGWYKSFPQAGGKRQSPIDIQKKEVKYDTKLAEKPLKISYDPNRTKSLINNGLTFRVDIDACDSSLEYTESERGPLDEKYQLVQFHAHWGSKDEVGAEHTFDGKQYSAEVHLVHWNTEKFKSVGDAIKEDRGIAVLGSFLKVGSHHTGFDKLIPFLRKVQKKGSQTTIEGGFDPSCLLPDNKEDYFTYEGSLTTPPCYESVTFILFSEAVEVSPEQLQALRDLLTHSEGKAPCNGHDHIVDNYRPVCPTNGRVVRASFSA
ncbi:carbonic anhydrase-like [Diadema antillarum]|uniref:carbonic anhydrase-like n=1 Tax=Diadema antillarum TaxID=105358 RepID=UPI003A85D73B